jgi:hypothetical protein
MIIGIYADQTRHFTDEEIAFDNWCEIDIPEEILRKWYEEKDLAEETANELKKPIEDVTFEDWFYEVSQGDDTDGLYRFSVENGYIPHIIGKGD